MKTIFLILFSAFCLVNSCDAQPTVADTAQATIHLKAKYHAYIISFMGDRGQPDRFRYINQVADQLTDTANRDQEITVTVRQTLIVELYSLLGNQAERLTTNFNAEIKQALVPQIMQYPYILQSVLIIAKRNGEETEGMVQSGFQFLQAVKQ